MTSGTPSCMTLNSVPTDTFFKVMVTSVPESEGERRDYGGYTEVLRGYLREGGHRALGGWQFLSGDYLAKWPPALRMVSHRLQPCPIGARERGPRKRVDSLPGSKWSVQVARQRSIELRLAEPLWRP